MNQGGSSGRPGQQSPQWLRYLALFPLVVGAAVFSVFFLAAAVFLFLLTAVGFGLRLWWVRRRSHTAASGVHGQPLEGEFTVVRDKPPDHDGSRGRLRR